MLFGVTVLLYFIKILGGSRNYWPNLRATDPSLHIAAVTLQKLYYKEKKTELDIDFLVKCRDHNITPNSKPRRQSFKRTYYISITPPPLL